MIELNETQPLVNCYASGDGIQSYFIELMPLFDGRLSVAVLASLCECDGELESMDLGTRRVASLEEALAFVRNAVAGH
jgi:hypothetical protein